MKTSLFSLLLCLSILSPSVFAGSGADIPYMEDVVTNYDKFNAVGEERVIADWNNGLKDLVLEWHEQALRDGEFDRTLTDHLLRKVLVPMPQKNGGWQVADPKVVVTVVPYVTYINEAAFEVRISHDNVEEGPFALIDTSVVTYRVLYSNPWLKAVAEAVQNGDLDRDLASPISVEEAALSVTLYKELGEKWGVDFFQSTSKPLVIQRFQIINGGTTGRIFAEAARRL